MTPVREAALAAILAALAFLAVPAAADAQTLPPPPPPPPIPSATATPFPSATPPGTESPTPSPFGTPPPSGAPSPSPSASSRPGLPIRVDRARAGVVPGTTVVVNVAGGVGPLVAQASFDGVDVRYDDFAHTLALTGRANGRGTVTISDAYGDSAVVNVLVAPPAGVVPADAVVELAGNITPQFATARVQATIAQLAQMQPGATIAVAGVTSGTLRPGDALEARANVTLRGNDTYVDQSGTTNVHLRVASLPPLDPVVLFYSDDPERLGPLDDGVLFRGTIDPTRPARAYVYHVSDTGSRRLYLALQATGSASRVQVLSGTAGPSDAFSYVGHLSTLRYMLERAPQESFVATVAPGLPYLIPLGAGTLLPGQLIASINDLRVLDGGPVNVMVVAAGSNVDPSSLLAQPEHPTDGHFRRGEFSLTNVPPVALTYSAGGPEPQPFAAGVRYYANGQAAFPNLRPDIVAQAGQRAPLAGDYGVLRTISLQIANPTSTPQNVYLYEQPGANGGVTTTMWFTGDPAPTEVRCVSDPSQRYLVKGFGVAPGQTLNVTGSYMTDGTSFLPVLFGLTQTVPPVAPVNGCGPKPGVPPPSN
ncbi:MAG TPA: hypothetical protein VGX96_21265 [Candidatus Elarobacter sp.]|nr:hypothetical protein [Candidatus Elarobacter sp.]